MLLLRDGVKNKQAVSPLTCEPADAVLHAVAVVLARVERLTLLLVGLAPGACVSARTQALVASDQRRAVSIHARIRVAVVDLDVAVSSAVSRIADARVRGRRGNAVSVRTARCVGARVNAYLACGPRESR